MRWKREAVVLKDLRKILSVFASIKGFLLFRPKFLRKWLERETRDDRKIQSASHCTTKLQFGPRNFSFVATFVHWPCNSCFVHSNRRLGFIFWNQLRHSKWFCLPVSRQRVQKTAFPGTRWTHDHWQLTRVKQPRNAFQQLTSWFRAAACNWENIIIITTYYLLCLT